VKLQIGIILILISTAAFTEAQEQKFHIAIDPGHGGNDIGAAKNKIQESNLVLSVAKKIERLLQEKHPEIRIDLTRSQNKYISLDDRIKNINPDLFISLHANSSISNTVSGMETYFQPDQKMISESISEGIKDSIVQDLESIGKTKHSLMFSKTLQSQWPGPSILRRSGFYVIEKTNFPSVLIEIGFLTNPIEAEKLKADAYQTQIAETIVNSVLDYKNYVH
jgi:N-acetylmuramoyl-L-alanine amidase